MGFGFCTSIWGPHALRFAALGFAGFAGVATLGPHAYAQLVPSAASASAPVGDSMERAQRQADNVMRWIKVHSDKPRTAPVKPAEPAAVVAAKPTTAAAPKAATIAATVVDPIKPVLAAVAEPIAPSPAVAPPLVAPPMVVAAAVAQVPEPLPLEEEEIPLKAIAQEQPVIPRNVLASLNAVGKVVVQFRVEANGNVGDIQVLSSTRSQLNRHTTAAVAQWRFEPIKTPRIAQIEFVFTPL